MILQASSGSPGGPTSACISEVDESDLVSPTLMSYPERTTAYRKPGLGYS